jgi:hypothetical protein
MTRNSSTKQKQRSAHRKTSFTIVNALILFLVFGSLGTLVIYLIHASPITNTCARSSIDVPSCGVLWGAYVPSEQLTTLESQVGRQFDIFMQYNDFSTGTNGQIPNSADLPLIQGGRTLLASWQPRIYSSDTNYSWTQIADGSLDSSVIIPQAQRIKALGSTKIFLAFDSEMDDLSTHPVASYGTPADYVAAYQHIYNVFKAQGVSNVIWVWTPTGYSGNYSTLSQYYPGDAYVNWVGYDPYNFYQCNSNETTWRSPTTLFSGFYNWVSDGGLGTGAETKPMILDEYGSHDDAADPIAGDSDWYAQIPAALQALPRLKALSEFDSVGICTSQLLTAADIAGFAQAGLSSTVVGNGGASTPPVSPTPTPTPSPTPDTTPPSVSLSAPSNGATISGTQVVSGSASDNVGVSKVTLYVDGSLVASDTATPYTFSLDTTKYSNGTHTIYLEAFDAAGNHSDSATVSISVKNNATTSPTNGGTNPVTPTPTTPTTTISATAPSSATPIAVSGNLTIAPASPSSPVTLKVDGQPVAGNSINTTNLTNGTHIITITEDGKTKSQAITVHNPRPKAIRNYLQAHRAAAYVSVSSLLAVLLAIVWFGRNVLLRRFIPAKVRANNILFGASSGFKRPRWH